MTNDVFGNKPEEEKEEKKLTWDSSKFDEYMSKNNKNAGAYEIGKALGKGSKKLFSLSDERCKQLFSDSGEDKIDCLAKIHSYDFVYKPEVQEELGDKNLGVDDKVHSGVMAQELEDNPAFKGVVLEDVEGYKALDIRALTMANTGAIGDLARRVAELEKVLGDR